MSRTDVHSEEQRSRNMKAIKWKDTKPEIRVRRFLHSQGYRYRLHVKELPGKPDIVFTKKKKIIEVRGCFWHMHDCKYGRVQPKTNSEFWEKKRKCTVLRDNNNLKQLQQEDWQILIVWECETKDMHTLEQKVLLFVQSE